MTNGIFSLLLVLTLIIVGAAVSGAFLLAEHLYNRRRQK
jgi:hypothetical protein